MSKAMTSPSTPTRSMRRHPPQFTSDSFQFASSPSLEVPSPDRRYFFYPPEISGSFEALPKATFETLEDLIEGLRSGALTVRKAIMTGLISDHLLRIYACDCTERALSVKTHRGFFVDPAIRKAIHELNHADLQGEKTHPLNAQAWEVAEQTDCHADKAAAWCTVPHADWLPTTEIAWFAVKNARKYMEQHGHPQEAEWQRMHLLALLEVQQKMSV